MNCPQCKNDMVLTQATNFGDQYHYCRSCKKELSEMRSELPNEISFAPVIAKEIDLPDLEPGEIYYYDGTTHVSYYVTKAFTEAPALEDLNTGSVVLAFLASMEKEMWAPFLGNSDMVGLDRMMTDCDLVFNQQPNLDFEREMDKTNAEIERQMIMPKGYFLMGEWE